MSIYFWKKLLTALCESYKTFALTPHPKLIMTLLVKNEEDVLEDNLLFHKAMGVDGFIITDNNSTDRTPQIISKYQAKGWVLEVIHETAVNYAQKVWVDRMIWKAKTVYHADWVINADADELWYSPSGCLKQPLTTTHANVLGCDLVSVYPDEDTPFWQWDRMIRAVPREDLDKYQLSPYSIFGDQNQKVIHRTASYLQIAMGNHKVTMFPRHKENTCIRVYHYNIRGKRHFLDKMINGGKQLEQNPKKHVGIHWRYFYKLYKGGLLEQEYDRVIGKSTYQTLYRDGLIYTDTSIADFFTTHIHGSQGI